MSVIRLAAFATAVLAVAVAQNFPGLPPVNLPAPPPVPTQFVPQMFGTVRIPYASQRDMTNENLFWPNYGQRMGPRTMGTPGDHNMYPYADYFRRYGQNAYLYYNGYSKGDGTGESTWEKSIVNHIYLNP